MRLLSRRALLYTEMISCDALLSGPGMELLGHDAREQPLALQIGGSDPGRLERAAKLAVQAGYREINLNMGCPSARTQRADMGARLMQNPRRAAECVAALSASGVLVSVKCRTGVDNLDSDDFLFELAGRLKEAGCSVLIVHARSAWLNGISPKQNRCLPPLNYQRVYRLKQFFEELTVIINGGLHSILDCQSQLKRVDGVMLGRSAYQNPYMLSCVDNTFFGDQRPIPLRAEILTGLAEWQQTQKLAVTAARRVIRHILGLYSGQPGARCWRRFLTEQGAQHCHNLLQLFRAAEADRQLIAADHGDGQARMTLSADHDRSFIAPDKSAVG